MLYTSMIAQALPSRRLARARALSAALLQGTPRGQRPRAAALGLVGTGKLEHEATLPSPEALAADVAAVRAIGIDDLALFALEGVLNSPDPDAWCSAFTLNEAPASAPTPGFALGWSVRAARIVARLLATPALRV